jgi:hypothetical protein
MTQWTIVYFIPRTFHLLQCCSVSVQSVDPLPENRFQSANADFVQNLSDSRKKFISRPKLLSLDVVFDMPKQETTQSQKELGTASMVNLVDVVQFGKNRDCKTLLSVLLYVTLHCPH